MWGTCISVWLSWCRRRAVDGRRLVRLALVLALCWKHSDVEVVVRGLRRGVVARLALAANFVIRKLHEVGDEPGNFELGLVTAGSSACRRRRPGGSPPTAPSTIIGSPHVVTVARVSAASLCSRRYPSIAACSRRTASSRARRASASTAASGAPTATTPVSSCPARRPATQRGHAKAAELRAESIAQLSAETKLASSQLRAKRVGMGL